MEKEEVKNNENDDTPEAVEKVPVVVPITPEEAPAVIEVAPIEERKETAWTPKTNLGRQVFEGKIKNIAEILFDLSSNHFS